LYKINQHDFRNFHREMWQFCLKYQNVIDTVLSILNLILSGAVILLTYSCWSSQSAKLNVSLFSCYAFQCECAAIVWSWFRRPLMLALQRTRTINGYH